ncbi:MAG: MBL fold metallo-hydrolase [Coriobacteriia bacterium]|nr:MBL fold metallo-hydrolase [Coriobacteriia bacterium]
MRVTVLGSAASHAAQGQACAGHLVECDETRVLFDCGNGVLANLYRVADPTEIDAVFVTHNHPDHYVDLYSMQSMLRYSPEGPAPAVPLFMPETLFERMQLLLSERGALEFREAFTFRPLEHGRAVSVGCLTVTPLLVDHTEPTYALVAECAGRRFVYTSDTAPGPRVAAAAEGADLLLAEATLPEQWAGASPHLTARQAGELARGAGVKQLVLAHVWPTNDREAMQRQADEAFGRAVTIATEFDVFDVG